MRRELDNSKISPVLQTEAFPESDPAPLTPDSPTLIESNHPKVVVFLFLAIGKRCA